MTGAAVVGVLAAIVLALPASLGEARAQVVSSPYAGTWRGTVTNIEQPSCGGTLTTYVFTLPWSGTVSDSGEFRGVWGPASATRDGAPFGANQPTGYPAWSIQADGSTTSVYGVHEFNGAVNCDLTAQYSASPSLSMAGDQRCAPQSYVEPVSGRTCTNTIHISVQGTAVPPAPAPPPVFQMEVRSNITPQTATAAADIQFRAQDVGTNASIYTFAVAPRSQVKAAVMGEPPYVVGKALALAGDKDTPVDCVLAQLNSSGQLISVTSAQLQAYSSGTLSASGASVTLLNNAYTPAVAGATFYVGYGASSSTMLTNGIYRNALTVPGSSVCPMISSQTALFWNPAESGWGLNLNHQGNTLFGTLFTYEASRAPLWLVMSAGAMQSDGVTFTGDLYRTTGPAFNANPFIPIGAANLTKVGTMTVSFIDVNGGTLRYTVNGVEVTKAIQRQVFGARAAACFPSTASQASATNYQDLWWNAAESGWGINITHQDSTLFATLFTYDATGRALWLVMSSGQRQGDGSYLGDLFQTAGPAFNADPFSGVTVATVGTMRLRFSEGNNGTLTYTYNGVTVTKAITRQIFSSPVPACS